MVIDAPELGALVHLVDADGSGTISLAEVKHVHQK
jgi:hypothetical protein